jgi:hypothetical protein
VNCAECEEPATVYNAGVPLCGTCFYKRALGQRVTPAEPANHDVWQRLTAAVAALEVLIARIAGEVEELNRKRNE